MRCSGGLIVPGERPGQAVISQTAYRSGMSFVSGRPVTLRHAKTLALVVALVLLGFIATACSGSTPKPPPKPKPTFHHVTGPVSANARGIPQMGTLVGSAYGSNSDPSAWERQMGATLGVHRTYWGPSSVGNGVRTAADDIAKGRVPWISFKVPYSWSEMADGRGDEWVQSLAERLSKLAGPVWVAFNHEPEGDGPIAEWTAMQARLAPMVRSIAPNVAYSIILTGYSQLYGASEYHLDSLWPKDTKIDLAGFDIYNKYGVVKHGNEFTDETDVRRDFFDPISHWAKDHDVAWGLAETGITDRAAAERPDLLKRMYYALEASGGVVLTYFNTSVNSESSWPLESPSKKLEFAKVLRSAPTLTFPTSTGG
jgi:hypothetical protein